MFTDLSAGEAFFIETLRRFDFLRTASYFCDGFSFSVKNPSLRFQSGSINQYVRFHFSQHPRIIIERRSGILFFGRTRIVELDDVMKRTGYSILDEIPDTLKERMAVRAKFMKDHLMPVINGEMWIDDFLGKK
ncbi:hypothetical protein KQH82_13115 [bacterium]|nr:hypothetical protein [bacterium]